MNTAFERIQQGLQEALHHAQGNTQGVILHYPKPIDVREIRTQMGMTQTQFATRFGFSATTVRHWERGERTPRGPALTLLNVIAREPQAVMRALS